VWSRQARAAGFTLLSAFIVWHAIGIAVVGPFSNSYLRENLLTVYQYYLPVFHLNRNWPFYAPDPFLGSILSYETVDTNGEKLRYPLTHAREKFDHAYFRYTNLYAYLFSDAGYSSRRGYDKAVASYLCRQHAPQQIKSVMFVLQIQKSFNYEDYRNGKRPLDAEFIAERTFGPFPCASSKGAAS
jgi:hypothetical protein